MKSKHRPLATSTPVKLFRDLDQLPERFRRGAVSIGNFDGVHRGHARIIERLSAVAGRVGGAAVVFTFDPHPARLLRPQAAPLPMSWTQRKARLLTELGADAVVAHRTDQAFLRLDPGEFFDRIVRGGLEARAVVEGPNFFFGRGRTGTIDVLRQLCMDAGVILEVVEPVEINQQIVSSSRVRTLIAAGRLDQARPLLCRPHRIRGTVIGGKGRGTKLGYPTANIGGIDTLLPGEGIYAGRAWIEDAPWPAAISIGPNPTFDERTPKVEAYLIGYQGSLYDQIIELDFLARLRDIERFDSVDRLVAQLDRDVAATCEIVQQHNCERG